MTKEQIEKKAKEIANKYALLGFKGKTSNERYEAAMDMAEWLLGEIAEGLSKLKKGGEK